MDLMAALRETGGACTEVGLAELLSTAQELGLEPHDITVVGAVYTPGWDGEPPAAVESAGLASVAA